MTPTREDVLGQLEKVLGSELFQSAGRLSRFLRFVTERALAGESERLKEYVIGVEVFDRDAQYDPRLDSIVRVEAGRLRLAASMRLTSDQFEDDRNSLVLPGFGTFDLQGAVRVTDSTEAFVAVENASGDRYVVGLTPLPTLGPPRLVRVGVRARWGRDPRP